MNIAVGDFLVNRLFNRAAVNQCFQVTLCVLIRLAYHLTHNAVGGRIRPVRQRKLRNLVAAVIYIVDDAPRVIDFDVTEQISVVPPLHLRQFFLQIIVGKHFLYFAFGKSEAVCVFGTQNAVNFQIVQPCKNAFFADSEAARNHAFLKVWIGLERRFKEGADEVNHLIVKAFEIRIFQRHIVLVDEDDAILSMILPQTFR